MTVIVICAEKHPKTGDTCDLPQTHTASTDPQVKQHRAPNGVKWPSLHELDPAEGYNTYVTHRI
jgi:hypothetical protein